MKKEQKSMKKDWPKNQIKKKGQTFLFIPFCRDPRRIRTLNPQSRNLPAGRQV